MKRFTSCLLSFFVVSCGGTESTTRSPRPDTQATPADSAEVAEHDEAEQVAAIQYVVNGSADAVYQCGALGRADDMAVAGVIELAVTLGDAGAVTEVVVTKDEPADSLVTRCMTELWKAVQFPPVFAAGDRIQLPAFRFVAPSQQFVINAAHVKPIELPSSQVKVQRLITKANTGNGDVELAAWYVGDGGRIDFQSSEYSDAIYILGAGTVLTSKAKGVSVGEGAAFYGTPGQAFGYLDASDGEPTMLIRMANLSKKVPPQKRPGAGLVLQADQAETLSIAGGMAQVLLYFDRKATKGDTSAYLGVLQAKAGTKVAEHVHATSSEVLFLLAGEGTMTVAENTYQVKQGDAIQIPPGTMHSFQATKPIMAVQYYSPSGPEQRFRAKP